MHLLYWINLLLQQLAQTSWIEWLAVGFSVAEVLLARANKVALYPAGIVATLLSVYLFIVSGLYAESLLNTVLYYHEYLRLVVLGQKEKFAAGSHYFYQ